MTKNAPAKLATLAKGLRRLNDRKKELEHELEIINSARHRLHTVTIPAAMEEYETDEINIPGAGKLTVKPQVYGYVNVADREEFFDWLRQNNNGSLIKEAVHPKTLNSFCKEILDNNESSPKFLKITPVPTAKLTGKG